ncbi:9934_t:CDS:2 [Acaulospora morrowiae]|uniref:9934_t:CDS:1 n=1 Tax=Acaulospora morrowiae TaxID=94023 RepID=A0A9N9A0Y8_9GLOM|nr:9934_t:CDS:2 [Acaulospora morrowiae]
MKDLSTKRFRRFNFTLYEHVDISFVKLMEDKFNDSNNCIQYIIFQLEFNHHASGTGGRVHMQGFVILKDQMRIGKYNPKGEFGSEIKNIFKSNSIHIDFANGTPEQYRDYCQKICEKCDDNCIRDLARVCDVNEDDTPSGPWEFGVMRCDDPIKGNRRSKRNSEIECMAKVIDKIVGGEDINEVLVEYAPMISSRVTVNIDRIAKTVSNVNNRFEKQCWDPCNIYIFETPGTGKTFWTSIVFPNAYKKSMDDDWKCSNENSGLWELYDYYENLPYYEISNGFRLPNRKYYSAIERRFNFIIEYHKIRDDGIRVCNVECTCCRIQRIFHKGSREKFQKLKFDIEFDRDITQDCALEIVRKLNRKGKLLRLDNKIIWREDFNNDNRYMVDDGDELHLDFIVYPEIIEKLNRNNHNYEIEIIEEICELRDDNGMRKRRRDYDTWNHLKLRTGCNIHESVMLNRSKRTCEKL